ncbi:MAG: nucleotidyltransferase family protein [Oscillospiraceae bacterium]|nr:nucleotidyltransferase family protein [Oscillospiraceae bacterium]
MRFIITNLISAWSSNQTVPPITLSTDWSAIYKELTVQSIAYLFTDMVADVVPDDLSEKWINATMYNIHLFTKIQNEQHDLYELLSSHNIEMAILKGTAAAVNYPNPEYRAMGDIDFLVPIEKFDEAYHLMLDNGYVLTYDEDNVDYHYTLEKNGITFEIHKYPAGMKSDDEYLFGLFQDSLKNVQLIPCETYEVPVLPTLQNGLVLLLHIVKHLDGGLGFRQIIDWMMFVDKHLDDIAYINEFKPVFEKAGLDVIAKTVTKMCQMYLGLREEITWCSDADEDLCTALLDYFYTQGNFGRKVKEKPEERGTSLFSKCKNIGDFFKTLQKYGMGNWKAVKKHPWLKPFAWLYQAGRYAKAILTGKYKLKGLKSDLAEGKQRRSMVEALRIFKI